MDIKKLMEKLNNFLLFLIISFFILNYFYSVSDLYEVLFTNPEAQIIKIPARGRVNYHKIPEMSFIEKLTRSLIDKISELMLKIFDMINKKR